MHPGSWPFVGQIGPNGRFQDQNELRISFLKIRNRTYRVNGDASGWGYRVNGYAKIRNVTNFQNENSYCYEFWFSCVCCILYSFSLIPPSLFNLYIQRTRSPNVQTGFGRGLHYPSLSPKLRNGVFNFLCKDRYTKVWGM